MGLQAVGRFHHHAEVIGLGERAVIRGRTAHVNHAFLESNNLTGGYDTASLQCMGPSAAHLRAYLPDHTWKNLSASADFYPWLNHILYRCDPHRLARPCNVNMAASQLVVFQYKLFNFLFADIKDPVLHVSLVVESDIFYKDFSQFKLHMKYLPLLYILLPPAGITSPTPAK